MYNMNVHKNATKVTNTNTFVIQNQRVQNKIYICITLNQVSRIMLVLLSIQICPFSICNVSMYYCTINFNNAGVCDCCVKKKEREIQATAVG